MIEREGADIRSFPFFMVLSRTTPECKQTIHVFFNASRASSGGFPPRHSFEQVSEILYGLFQFLPGFLQAFHGRFGGA